jgi:hypothetical protein
MPNNEAQVITRIQVLVKTELPTLAPHLRKWAEKHLITPRKVSLSLDENGTGEITLWLVTDHVGESDSACRVVFDETKGWFGLEMAMKNNIHWFMGLYGGFAETIEGM